MSTNTNRSRAARRVQAASDLTYAQALAIVRNATHIPDLGTPEAVREFLATQTPVTAPDPAPAVRRLVARFVPQAWINDYAVDVDAEGDTTWDVTDEFARLPRSYRDGLLAEIDEHGSALDTDDALAEDPAAPAWVRAWSGPFSLWVSYAPEATDDDED